MNNITHVIKRGHGTKDRPLARELWAREAYRPDAFALKAAGDFIPDNRHIDFERYFDPVFAEQELDAVWRTSWLFAAREEDLPGIGDRVPFDAGTLSFMIIWTDTHTFKAYYNSCPHRGTMLCHEAERGYSIRCPFHGWEWDIDGDLKKIPGHWDFPDLKRGGVPPLEIRVERWGGFIFINADDEAPPLINALGPIPKHFEEFDPSHRYTAARFRKLVNANWKISQEAFMEAYHRHATHPEAAPFNGDSQTQYDIWTGGAWPVARNANCAANPSVHAPAEATAYTASEMYVSAMKAWHFPDGELPVLDPTADIRAQLGSWHRAQFERTYGRATRLSDAELMDSFLYYIFPHTVFWLSEAVPFTYQFTPHPTNPQKSYLDVRLMLPYREGAPQPPSSPAVILGEEDTIHENVPQFGLLGYVLDQDLANMPLVQRGMQAAHPRSARSHLSVYQEIIVQPWNEVIDLRITDH